MKIGIGIDTGGTCTDAVAYDFESEELLAKSKTLTTREDLSVGIRNALDMLPRELVGKASLISLSTTLATNACVEDKGCRAKLLIFGLTDELITRYKAESKYGFKKENVRCVDVQSSADGLSVHEPEWDDVVKTLSGWLSDADALAIAELYSMSNGAPCEKRAKVLLSELFNLQSVGASELSGELDVLARGATALLNARLFPIGREFTDAALSDFAARGCKAPVMIVRSDGSLMSSELTRSRPVETILSGPAASVLAGRRFSDAEDSMIIDMGGTTTDVSIIRGGKPAAADNGIQIGGWRTHVKGVFIDTFALGGDSTVRIKNGKVSLLPRRATPICSAAKRYPEIKTQLRELLDTKHTNLFPLHEFLYLVREPADRERYNNSELKLIDVLSDGPYALGLLAASRKIDLYHLDSERLEAEGVIMRCALTPTDFMHLRGDYSEYDAEGAELAASFMLMNLGRETTAEELRTLSNEVYDMVGGCMYENLVRILLTRKFHAKFSGGLDTQTEFLIRDAWQNRHIGTSELFRQTFNTNAVLIGVGAPTHVFLPEVADALGANFVLPDHAEVANAIGALMADIHAASRVEVTQRLSSEGRIYYIVHAPTGSLEFDDFKKASIAAQNAAEKAALEEANARGAMGRVAVNTYIDRHTAETKWGLSVSMGCTAVSEVTARFG